MIANIIAFYYVIIGIVVIMTFAGYVRGTGISVIRLALLAVIATISFPLAKLLAYPLSEPVLNRFMGKLGYAVSTVAYANPELIFTLKKLISAILPPILTAVIFAALQLISLVYFDKLASKLTLLITKDREFSPKKESKICGACLGAVSGLLTLFVMLTPVAFGASVLIEAPTESLESIDRGFLSKPESVQTPASEGALKRQGAPRSSLRLKTLKNGIAVFGGMSEEYQISGYKESLQKELANLLAAAGDSIASYEFSIEANPDDKLTAYLNTIAALGANTEHSALINSLVRETSRAIGNLEEEKITELLEGVPNADIIGGVLPGIFAAIADTPSEEIPETFAMFFGDPPVEPARTRELREQAENDAMSEEIEVNETEAPVEPDVTDAPETEPTASTTETQKPQTAKPAAETQKPVTKAPSETAKAPETSKNTETAKPAETSKAPETTKKVETTKTPETTKAPEQTAKPAAGGNTGLLGALLGGGSVSDKTDDLTKNKALFDSIRNGAFKAISAKLDITNEDYSWMYVLIQSELSNVLKEVKANPSMTYKEKVDFFAASITQNMSAVIPAEAYEAFGVEFILKPSSMEVIAIFTLDNFTLEKYPDCKVPMKDIMTFMGIAKKDIPDWAKKYN